MKNIINCSFFRLCRSRVSVVLFRVTLFSRIGGGYYPHGLSSLPRPSRGLPLSVCLVGVCNHGVLLVAVVVRSVGIRFLSFLKCFFQLSIFCI